jgi:hypothetical protein
MLWKKINPRIFKVFVRNARAASPIILRVATYENLLLNLLGGWDILSSYPRGL